MFMNRAYKHVRNVGQNRTNPSISPPLRQLPRDVKKCDQAILIPPRQPGNFEERFALVWIPFYTLFHLSCCINPLLLALRLCLQGLDVVAEAGDGGLEGL